MLKLKLLNFKYKKIEFIYLQITSLDIQSIQAKKKGCYYGL